MARVLLVHLNESELRRATESGGLIVKFVVTHANIKVEVHDDGGSELTYSRADIGTK